jgi:hypothetical protein
MMSIVDVDNTTSGRAPTASKKLLILTDVPAITQTASLAGDNAMQSVEPRSVLKVLRELTEIAVLGGVAGQTAYAPDP